MNIPNQITVLSDFDSSIYIICSSKLWFWKCICIRWIYDIRIEQLIAAIIFIVASLSDFLDGYLARKWQLVTNMGKFLDPN